MFQNQSAIAVGHLVVSVGLFIVIQYWGTKPVEIQAVGQVRLPLPRLFTIMVWYWSILLTEIEVFTNYCRCHRLSRRFHLHFRCLADSICYWRISSKDTQDVLLSDIIFCYGSLSSVLFVCELGRESWLCNLFIRHTRDWTQNKYIHIHSITKYIAECPYVRMISYTSSGDTLWQTGHFCAKECELFWTSVDYAILD